MRKHLKHYLIPHEGNDYKPHVFRAPSALIIAGVVGLLFVVATGYTLLLQANRDYLAAVLPAVLVDLTNSDRGNQQLATLTVNPLLERAAQMKANDMAARGYFAHVTPDGLTPWYWITEAGYAFSYAGENLAVNFVDSGDVETAWMQSTGHRANILNQHFTEIGIATATGTWNGRPTVFVVQMFGRPAQTVARTVSKPIVPTTPTKPATVVLGATTDQQKTQSATATPTPATKGSYIALGTDDTVMPTEQTTKAPKVARPLDRLLTTPHAVLSAMYFFIALFIAFALLLNVFVVVRRQHLHGIAYAILLLLLIAALSYLNWLIIASRLVIA